MDDTSLRTYLQDHLAGATGVIELVDRRRSREPEAWLDRFRAQLATEHDIVTSLAEQLDSRAHPVKRSAGWMAEKAAQAKLVLDGRGDDALRDLLELEVMRTGVEGKRCLWRTLGELTDDDRIAAIDLDRLRTWAEQQAEELERRRLAAARAAFGGQPSPSVDPHVV